MFYQLFLYSVYYNVMAVVFKWGGGGGGERVGSVSLASIQVGPLKISHTRKNTSASEKTARSFPEKSSGSLPPLRRLHTCLV